jgi:hypothetical protein
VFFVDNTELALDNMKGRPAFNKEKNSWIGKQCDLF